MIWATDNFFDVDESNSITTSSANSTYPITNAYRFQRRGRIYRTNGNVTINSTNKRIAFKESAMGSVLYTDIIEGSYLVGSTLLTAIKAALEDAGAATYTVTYTALNKIKIATSGGYFDLLWEDVQATARDVLGFAEVDLTGALDYTADYARIHSEEWVMVDFGLPINPECFIAIGKRNDQLNISESAVLKLQGNTTDNWTSPEFETTLNWNESVIQISNANGLHTQPLRYWRFYVEDIDNSSGFIQFSNFFFGKSWIPERGCAQFGFSNRLRDLSVTVYSDSGVSLSDVRQQTQEFAFEFNFMTKDDMDEFMFIFETYGTSKPFFIIMDPNGVMGTNPQDFTKYVKFTSEPDIRIVNPNVYNVSVNLREEL